MALPRFPGSRWGRDIGLGGIDRPTGFEGMIDRGEGDEEVAVRSFDIRRRHVDDTNRRHSN